MAVDKVENTMVRPSETELGQNGIGLSREIPVGKEEQLDECNELLLIFALEVAR